jgi:hypothetical protein
MARNLPVRLASLASLFASLAAASPASAQNEGTTVTPAPASAAAPATGDDDAQAPSASAPPAPAPPATPTEAHETEARYPVSRALRPLTLPKLYLTPSLDLSSAALTPGRFTNATFGAAFGITDNLTLRAIVAPLQMTSPSAATLGGVHYGETAGAQGPTLTATYRFLPGDVELGAFAGGQVLTAFNLSGYRLWAGVPLRAHVSKSVRVDIAPEVTFTHQTNEAIPPAGGVALNPQGTIPVTSIDLFPAVTFVRTTDRYALFIPLEVTWSMTELFHAGMSTGYVAGDLSSVKASSRIPLGIYGGYTVAGARGAVLDIDPYFDFPGLFRPGSSSQKTQTDWNEIGVTVRAHVDLL